MAPGIGVLRFIVDHVTILITTGVVARYLVRLSLPVRRGLAMARANAITGIRRSAVNGVSVEATYTQLLQSLKFLFL